MTRRFRRLLVVLAGIGLTLGLLPRIGTAQNYDFPPKPDGPVLDQANLLSSPQQRQLAGKLSAFEDTTSTAIVVVTVSSLDGAPIDDYAVYLGREWEVGQQGKDNGVVVLVSKGDRKVFIATGYGVEGALPDAVAHRIVDQVITPAFRNGNFFDGLDRGTNAVMAATMGEFTAEETPSASSDDGVSTALVYILLILLYFGGSALWRRRRGNGARSSRRGRGGLPIIIWGGGGHSHGGGGMGGGGFGGGGFGGFGGGSFGGGGAGGSW